MRTFSVKFPDDQAAMIEVLAAEQGQSLSTFIRERVLARDHLDQVLVQMQSGLHAAIHDGFRSHDRADKTAPDPGTHTALLLEAVLLLRSLANPQKVSAAQAELQRLGVTPFRH